MSVPTYDRAIEPLLRFLAEHPNGVACAEAYERVADRMGITPTDRLQLLPSGTQTTYRNRIAWAHDRLKRAGFSSSPRRGFWQITDGGRKFIAAHPKPFSEDEVRRIAFVDRVRTAGSPSAPSTSSAMDGHLESADDRIGSALTEIRESVARDLLERIGASSPVFFERLVLDLLHKLGYGTSRDDLQHVGGSGDGGIDGVISLDRLGLEKVYVQAKRWKNSVGSPEIQKFVGALRLKGATKGVLITSGAITKDARDALGPSHAGVVLIHGERLAELMIDHGVAVSRRMLAIPHVDSDYLEED